jgi:tRNA(Ile)-lysidine synthase
MLRRELDRLVLRIDASVPPDEPLRIHDRGPGAGVACLSGVRFEVTWGSGGSEPSRAAAIRHTERFDPEALRFPLTVRARRPGDRIRLAAGTKKVKKLFLERRIPAPRRERMPLLVDAAGEVLWIPDVARAVPPPGRASRDALRIGIG